nr:YdcF family protein [Thiomicrorhabdus cannonii]
MLILAVLSLVLSGGLFWLWRVLQIARTARHAPAQPPNSLYAWILFGKQLHNDLPDADFQRRLQGVLRLAEHQPLPPAIVLLGGKTGSNRLSEAQAAADYLLTCRPALQPALLLEEASRNTLENLKQARDYLPERNLPVALISNRYHLHRCMIMAGRLGLNAVPVAAEAQWQATPAALLKIALEGFFVHWYHTGAFISKRLNNQRMLNKIH